MVSETHPKKIIPDTNIAITNYIVYRRDRNWFGTDKRAKGGIAIYVRNNLHVIGVKRSDKFECICVKTKLLVILYLTVCGLHHPPKPSYQQDIDIEYSTAD